MACVAKYHRLLNVLDESPRKRRKLTSSWDVLPSELQSQPTIISADPENGNGKESVPISSGAEHSIPSDHSRSASSALKPKAGISRNGSPPWRNDDKNGHYVFELGENLTPRYKILSKMGEGAFGQVLECWDRKSKDFVAIKIVRGVQKYREAAMIEIDALREVSKYDKNSTRCVQMREWFDYRNHTCIVFEKLGPSLYDFLRKNDYRPFPIDLVREVGRQLLESVAYMHELNLVHTDLKPENILFVSSEYVKVPDCKGVKESPDDFKRLPKSSAIKIIDFGSTTFEHQNHTSVVATRHYRAPEVILGLGWNYPCDIWSIGCILVEICSGDTLFQTHENLEHLAMMERVLGALPRHMIKKADRRYAKYFRHGTRLNWPEGASSRESIRTVRKLPKLRDSIKQHVDQSADLFIDLLQGLLRFEPSERLTALQALRHPFFREGSTGRLASRISVVLQGKDKPTYTPNREDGDMCIVINAKDICVTGKKLTDKVYRWHTGYIGHLKERTLKDQMVKDPTEVIRKAVFRMLPKNKLQDDRDRKLRIFAGSEHPFTDRPLEGFVMPPRKVREMRPRLRRAMIRAQKKAEQSDAIKQAVKDKKN